MPLFEPKESLGAICAALAEEAPDKPAFTDHRRTVTRGAFDRATNRLGRAYAAKGIGEGDLVALTLPNGIDFFEAAFALWKLGAVPQVLSPKMAAGEREAILELAKPKAVIGLETGRICIPPDFRPDPALADTPLPDRISPNWKIVTSGGSTGRPKLIVSKEPGAFDREFRYHELPTESVILNPGPLSHNAPLSYSVRGFLLGNHVVCMQRFDAAEMLTLIERHHVEWVFLVPTMMQRVARLLEEWGEAPELPSLRYVVHAAAKCPDWLKDKWIDWLGAERIFEFYGSTEAIGRTWITGEEWLRKRGSVGRADRDYAIRILNDDGDQVPPGEIGEIYLKPSRGVGSTYYYIGAESQRRGEWETLGDLGWMDEEGYLYLADRRHDMIVRGGANIYPVEIEAAIDRHPSVSCSAVIGLPDDDLGQRLHAIVHAIAPVSADQLRTHLKDLIAKYKIPASFEFVDERLRDDAGKVRRSALREERLQGH